MIGLVLEAAERLELPTMLVGATARDVLLEEAYGVPTGRMTNDIDMAVSVRSWKDFEKLKRSLIATGCFAESPRERQRLHYAEPQGKEPLWIDIIPFGEIETADRHIAWPPDSAIIMNALGLREAYDSALLREIGSGVELHVVSLPGLAALKIIAWKDRKERDGSADAHDLTVILRNYLDAGNADRLHDEIPQLVERPDFDYTLAGAYLLGLDMQSALGPEVTSELVEILSRETDRNGAQRLVSQMAQSLPGQDDAIEQCLRLLTALLDGLEARHL